MKSHCLALLPTKLMHKKILYINKHILKNVHMQIFLNNDYEGCSHTKTNTVELELKPSKRQTYSDSWASQIKWLQSFPESLPIKFHVIWYIDIYIGQMLIGNVSHHKAQLMNLAIILKQSKGANIWWLKIEHMWLAHVIQKHKKEYKLSFFFF